MTPREIAEVQSHHRRRLVAAFLTGEEDGEVRSSGRAVVASAVLAGLLVAGGRVWPLLHH
jgi:hypothetical protein